MDRTLRPPIFDNNESSAHGTSMEITKITSEDSKPFEIEHANDPYR